MKFFTRVKWHAAGYYASEAEIIRKALDSRTIKNEQRFKMVSILRTK